VTSPNTRTDRLLPWFVLGVFVVLTLLVTTYVWRMSSSADRARFDNAVQTTRDAIESRLDTYVNVLTGTRALAVSDPAIPRDELRAYIRSLNVQHRYPGIQGIGVLLRVPGEEVPRLEREIRREGIRSFHVFPPGPREEYYPIVLIEPLDERNRRAMGYDMWTHPVRRDAMERARDTGRPAATGRVTLIQEAGPNKQSGFLIYTPIYATGTTPATLAERRAVLFGFIYAPFRLIDFFNGLFPSQQRPEIGFEVRDENQLLYRTEHLPADPRFTAHDRVQVAGRTWDIQWISYRHGGGGVALITAATLLGGIIISVLLFLLVRTQLDARAQAEQTAERLRASEAELQRANRAKDEFLATLSHELRTPMTSIMGWSQMLDDDDVDPATVDSGLEAIRKSAKIQAQLIDDLLDVSRITAGKMRLDRKPAELRGAVAAAVDTVRAVADAKGVTLHADFAPGVMVEGDPHRLQQIVWNLLSNAVKFTPAGGDVFVTLREENAEAVIEVRDTGQGIEPAFMPHLFERFRQADSSTTRAHMGLGLGLAIVRHLVELHGGTVSAESGGPGRGSKFRVRLPVLRETPIAQVTHEPPDASTLRGVRVLVVDDDAEVRQYVTAVFQSGGAEPRSAGSAREALKILDEWPADVVLSDLAMPEADGFDLLHWIRTSPIDRVRAIPVIALTAFAMPEDRERVLDGGFQAFVAKPVEPSRLRTVVAEAVGRNLTSQLLSGTLPPS